MKWNLKAGLECLRQGGILKDQNVDDEVIPGKTGRYYRRIQSLWERQAGCLPPWEKDSVGLACLHGLQTDSQFLIEGVDQIAGIAGETLGADGVCQLLALGGEATVVEARTR